MQINRISHSNELLDHIHIHHKHLSVKIFPKLGGSVQELSVNGTKILDGISVDENGLDDYKKSYKSAVLFPFPNRVKDGTYQYNDTPYQLDINEKSLNNALHGLVFDKTFRLTGSELLEERAKIELTYKSDGTLPGFPFRFKLKLIYRISFQGGLSLTFKIKNTDNRPFPYGMGWHPYFYTQNLATAVLSIPAQDFYGSDNRGLPLEPVPADLPPEFELDDKNFDDAFSLKNPRCDFKTDEYNVSLGFKYPEGTYLQVYTPPHRQNIAIEPMTCIANAVNNKIGFSELAPEKSDTWRIDLFYITKS